MEIHDPREEADSRESPGSSTEELHHRGQVEEEELAMDIETERPNKAGRKKEICSSIEVRI